MQKLTPAQASEQNYQSITIDICPVEEASILTNLEKDMKTCDAVWIAMPNGKLQCARKASELDQLLYKHPPRI